MGVTSATVAAGDTIQNGDHNNIRIDLLNFGFKAWGQVAANGTLQSNSFNITSVVRNVAGDYTITFDTDFTNTSYVPIIELRGTTGSTDIITNSAGIMTARTYDGAGVLADRAFVFAVIGVSV